LTGGKLMITSVIPLPVRTSTLIAFLTVSSHAGLSAVPGAITPESADKALT
jgi:hypothetical protein